MTLAILLVGMWLSACGDAGAPAATSPPATTGAGTQPSPTDAVTAAARQFIGGYLEFQAGTRAAADIPNAAVLLRRALRGSRISPAQRSRNAGIESIRVDRADTGSAHVTVGIVNRDEALTYPLALELVNEGGRWVVQSTGDDE